MLLRVLRSILISEITSEQLLSLSVSSSVILNIETTLHERFYRDAPCNGRVAKICNESPGEQLPIHIRELIRN